MKAPTYEELLKVVERLQMDLIYIDNYSEDVYQAFERLLDALDEVIYEKDFE